MTEKMHTTGVWKLDYPQELRRAVEETAQAWREFCALPDDVQDVLTADNLFNGSGFERKAGSGTAGSLFSHDKKMNFDVTARDARAPVEKVNEITNVEHQEVARNFLYAISSLVKEAPGVIGEFGKKIEDEVGVAGFYDLAQVSAPDAFFRCLYYPPTEDVGEVIGESHVDNSGFTLHLFESTDGCQALSADKAEWSPMLVAHGQALAFPSMQTQLYSEGKVDGLCHRILSNETTQNVGRIAIVCFVALKGLAAYDRGRHGRLQEMTPGFNYGMNPEEFADLFIEA